MTILAICSIRFPDIRILTFQVLSNHLHVCLAGDDSEINRFFYLFKKYFGRYLSGIGRSTDLSHWEPDVRLVPDLSYARNVVIYDNRNGFVVIPSVTPFSYPWGAGRFFFNPDAKFRHQESSRTLKCKEIRSLTRSHANDCTAGLTMLDSCVSPLSICHIGLGEGLFRDARHYFYSLSKNVESLSQVANDVGDRIYYTDSELYSIVKNKSREDYHEPNPKLVDADAKLALARMMHFSFHASNKQIVRILHIDSSLVNEWFPK